MEIEFCNPPRQLEPSITQTVFRVPSEFKLPELYGISKFVSTINFNMVILLNTCNLLRV